MSGSSTFAVVFSMTMSTSEKALSPDWVFCGSKLTPVDLETLKNLYMSDEQPRETSETWFVCRKKWLSNLLETGEISCLNNAGLLHPDYKYVSSVCIVPKDAPLDLEKREDIDVVSERCWRFIEEIGKKYVSGDKDQGSVIDISIPRNCFGEEVRGSNKGMEVFSFL